MSLYMTADDCKMKLLERVDTFKCPVCQHLDVLPVPRGFEMSTLVVRCPHGHGRLKFGQFGWEWTAQVNLRGSQV